MALQPHDRAKSKHLMRTSTRPNVKALKKQGTQDAIARGDREAGDHHFWRYFGRLW